MPDYEKELSYILNQSQVEEPTKAKLILDITRLLDHENIIFKFKLNTLYDYEVRYLGLIKEYKEEIKFLNSVQEDLRKEKAQFFSHTLKEVNETIKNSGVDSQVANRWIEELVDSYTKSLNLSSNIANTSVLDTFGLIKQNGKALIQSLNHEIPNKG